MVLLVLTIALANTALGFALAVFLDWRLRLPPPTIVVEGDDGTATPQQQEMQFIKPEQPVEPETPEPEEEPVEGVTLEDLPRSWQKQLQGAGIAANSFVEAAVEVLKLDIGELRQNLFDLEQQLRRLIADGNQAGINALNKEAQVLTRDWIERQTENTAEISQQSPEKAPYKGIAKRMNASLEEQMQSAQEGNTALVDGTADNPEAFHALLQKMIDSTHKLRDMMHHSLDIIMRHEGRLEDVDRPMLFDRLTSLYNHTGLEVLMQNWSRDNSSGQRLLSLAAIDIDDFEAVNRKVGNCNGDRVIAAFGQYLDNLRRKHRGYDRTCRFGGQMFVLFLGDTGPRNGISAAERMRQTVMNTTFEIDDVSLIMRMSCAVTEVVVTDSPDKIFARLLKGIRAAKSAGGNRTMIDEGSGPVSVEPPVYNVPGQVVTVE